MLEKMDAFFEARLDGYDAHMLNEIEGAKAFYPFTAAQLPMKADASVLDLGCGTGLELEKFFERNPSAKVTGIDLSRGMLDALRSKFPERDLTLICGSYFDEPLGEAVFDAAVSVESLHHFTGEEKISLYRKLYGALRPGGYFILTDYFAPSEADEIHFREELSRLKAEQGITDGAFYHYDTPLTAEHETKALREAGFDSVRRLNNWGNTVILRAEKDAERGRFTPVVGKEDARIFTEKTFSLHDAYILGAEYRNDAVSHVGHTYYYAMGTAELRLRVMIPRPDKDLLCEIVFGDVSDWHIPADTHAVPGVSVSVGDRIFFTDGEPASPDTCRQGLYAEAASMKWCIEDMQQ